MGRTNIFEIMNNFHDPQKEILRLKELLNADGGMYENDDYYGNFKCLSIIEYVDKYLFGKWQNRGTAISCVDFMDSVFQQNFLEINAECLLLYCEYSANITYLAKINVRNQDKVGDIVTMILDNINIIANWYGYELKYFPEQEKVLIVVKSAQATAVAEYLNSDLSYLVLEYNHYKLQGNIKRKKEILLALGNAFEPKRKQLGELNSSLERNIFQMLNNLNLRHNNTDEKDNKHYKKYVATLKESDLEQWYDDLYQMILLAYMMIENKNRASRINKLFKDIDVKEQND